MILGPHGYVCGCTFGYSTSSLQAKAAIPQGVGFNRRTTRTIGPIQVTDGAEGSKTRVGRSISGWS